MKKVIIVTGTPGTGKTTISRQLAEEIGARYLPLTQHVSSYGLYSGVDVRRNSKVMDLKRTRADLKRLLLKEDKTIVVDSHIPDVIAPKSLVKRVLVLRCHPKVLKSRLRAKKWKQEKVQENLLAEILDACLLEAVDYYGWRPVFEINTSHGSVRRCVTLAKASLRGKSRKKGRSFDWITTLNREHSLLRYLK
ncbi:MAG: AAA family ATPase [Candidatus Bathyarchaeia archaeon]|jgi:adenylate kinase